ncbi:hypothetical protein GCM10025867_51630 (plasmid) [Frondihabitans sucicola]|uniref:Uncharacterized protein n=1 Tax=Frondihabitans sucicola TaxID=1268041 RepID=A0ABM8GWP5_9MICO|nr:hypothetical protein [Frondihabitans sucicola]BDZ52355.1 hypothetical protein GCM10025867_45960 [Frondihabitans sucicola]BDZ52922.1 hypothetical protein GCM10025867_51630 [Frondihabitans sucicola]
MIDDLARLASWALDAVGNLWPLFAYLALTAGVVRLAIATGKSTS